MVTESVRKVLGQAEAIRFFNYPYEAIEEAVVNALYHRSYQDVTPVEVRIFPSRIEIISYPGPLPPLSKDNLNNEHVTARKYRNRRIGDFLKELHLTEGRGTGFPKIRRAMKGNGSPEPVFETDDDRDYFMTILSAHPEARVSAQVSEQVSEQVIQILEFCKKERDKREILHYLDLSPAYTNYKRHILPLLQNGLLAFTIPDKPKSRLQKYKVTESGLTALKRHSDLGTNNDESLAAHPEARVSEQVVQILKFCRTEQKKQEILNHLNLSPAYRNYKRHILPLLQNGLLSFIIPDKPRSRLQKYRTTGSGLAVLKHHAKNGEDENHLLNEAEMTT